MNGVIIDYAVSAHVHSLDHLTNIGSREKHYRITNKTRWKISGSCCNMWRQRQNKLTFWTFTIPGNSDLGTDGAAFNAAFSRVLENLKRTHKLNAYVWVRERHKSGVYHYHALLDMPFVDIKTINSYYENSISNYCRKSGHTRPSFHGCSVRLPSKVDKNGNYRGAVVRDLQSVIRYISKYITKAKEDSQTEVSRVYSITRNIVDKGTTITQEASRYLRYFDVHQCEREFFTIRYTDTSRLDLVTNIIQENVYKSVTDLIHKTHQALQRNAHKNTVRIKINKKTHRFHRVKAVNKHKYYCRKLRSINGRFLVPREKIEYSLRI
jgi:hypothetical protein